MLIPYIRVRVNARLSFAAHRNFCIAFNFLHEFQLHKHLCRNCNKILLLDTLRLFYHHLNLRMSYHHLNLRMTLHLYHLQYPHFRVYPVGLTSTLYAGFGTCPLLISIAVYFAGNRRLHPVIAPTPVIATTY